MAKKKKTKKRIKKVPILVLVFTIAIIISLVFIFKNKENTKNDYIGSWTSEGGTIYVFRKSGKGVMKTPLSEYNFKYKVNDDVISIDFKDKDVIDTDYEYYVNGNKLTLESDRGTFVFKKNK